MFHISLFIEFLVVHVSCFMFHVPCFIDKKRNPPWVGIELQLPASSSWCSIHSAIGHCCKSYQFLCPIGWVFHVSCFTNHGVSLSFHVSCILNFPPFLPVLLLVSCFTFFQISRSSYLSYSMLIPGVNPACWMLFIYKIYNRHIFHHSLAAKLKQSLRSCRYDWSTQLQVAASLVLWHLAARAE